MHAQMLLAEEVGQDRVRQRPEAHLDGVAVLDEAGHVIADPLGFGRRDRSLDFQQRFVMGNDEIDIPNVDESVAVDARHEPVDLGDDHPGVLRGRLDDVDADAEAQVAVVVGRGGLDQGHIDPDGAALKQRRHVRERNRRVVRGPLIDGISRVVPDEEGIVAEVALELAVRVGCDAEGIDMDDLGVEKGLRVRFHVAGHRLDQVLRLAAARGDEDVVAPADVAERDLLRSELLRMPLSPEIDRFHRRSVSVRVIPSPLLHAR